ncbi:head GIN domain-containing protein [Sphingomonas sp.]|jgi:hypothetical protein|uniref:head GIN domain-containing protein n=1 Tax=Sphingomonas sp. TaxID=28214 RepID=UPI0035C85617
MRAYVFAALLPLAACGNIGGDDHEGAGVQPTGSGTSRSFAVSDFTAVELAGPDNVDVRVGSAFSVRAEGDEAQLAKLRIERIGDRLKVGRQRRSGFSWSSGDGVKVFVTMPRITAAELAGSGNLSVDRAEGARFVGDLAGSGNLSVGMLAVRDAELSIAGSGNVRAVGSTEMLKIDIAGSGDVAAEGLTATSASVSIAGSGNVRARVDGDAKVSIMGSGDVDLGDRARCQTSKMGSGSVRCGR